MAIVTTIAAIKRKCAAKVRPKTTQDPMYNENKVYQVLEIESMEKMQEAMQDPEIAKARTDAGVDLDTQEVVFLVE